jgi:hypothetical protein
MEQLADPKTAAPPTRTPLSLFFLSFSLANTHCRTVQLLVRQTPVLVSRFTASASGARFGPLLQPRLSARVIRHRLFLDAEFRTFDCTFFCLLLLLPDRQKCNHAVCAL